MLAALKDGMAVILNIIIYYLVVNYGKIYKVRAYFKLKRVPLRLHKMTQIPLTQIPLDLEETTESYKRVAISFKPGQEAQLEAEKLSGLDNAWFDRYALKQTDAVSDEAVGQELSQGWFAAYKPLRIVKIR